MPNVYSNSTGPRVALSDVLSTLAAGGGVALVASNTTFTNGSVSISGFGAATVNTAASIIRISVPVQTVQTQNMVALSASDALFSSGTVVISGFGAATVNTAAGTIRISVPVQTAQTGISGLANSETTYTSGTVSMSALGAITIRSTTGNQFQFSVAAQTTQVETQTFVGGIAMNAATTYTSGTVVISAGANITLGSNAQTVTISGVAAQTVQTQNLVAISASNALFSSGTVVISGFGAATVNTAAGTIRISVPTQTTQVETQTFVGGIAMNAATTYTSGTIVLSAGANITLGSNGQTITISAAAGAGGIGGVAVNALTTYTSGTVVFSNSNGITFGTNAQTITASIPLDATMSSYYYNTAALYSIVASGQTNASASIVFMQLPQDVSFTRVDIPVSFQTASSATAATAAVAYSNVAVIYSRNGITLNPIIGASNTITLSWVSNSGIASSVTGARLLSFGLATALSPGMYWLGLHVSSTSAISSGAATTALNGTMSMLLGAGVASVTATAFGDFNAATNASVNVLWPLHGLISSAITATSQTLQQSQITQSGAGLVRANPMVIFRN